MECVRGRIIKIGCTRKCHKVYLMISSPHVRESRTILVSRFRIQETGFQYLSLKLGFWIPIVSEISDSTTKDSGFHKQHFPIFRNPRFPYMGRISPKIYIYIYIRWAKGFCVLISTDIENQIRIEVSHVNIRIGKQVVPFLHKIDCLQSRVSCKTSTNKIVQNPVLNCFWHRFDYPFVKKPVQYLWCHSCYFVGRKISLQHAREPFFVA